MYRARHLAVVACLMLLPSGALAAPNVVVVLVDAMRAQNLSTYGYRLRETTPNLDRFAKRGVVFERCLSQAAWTVPAVASLFTSKDPQTHLVQRYNPKERLEMDELSPAHDTLAEVFLRAGYQTVALKKSVVIDTNRGMGQGFEINRVIGGDMAEGRSAEQLTDAAIEWMRAERDPSRPFFLYLHYMDPHSSYRAPEPYYSEARGDYGGPLTGDHKQIEDGFVKGGQKPTRADLEFLVAQYDAEIRYWDGQFGRLMQHLVVSGLDPETIVAVVADHGEAFFEHGQWFHGNVWQENLQIPFVVKAPGIAPGRYGHWTELIDVAPTLADLAGVAPGSNWQGRSQAPVMRGGPADPRPVYGEYGPQRALITPEGTKLILGDGAPKLFKLPADPWERNDLASVRGMVVDRLKAELNARVEAARAAAAGGPPPASQALTPEQIEQLKAMGYIE